ncbi:MAG TPA: acyltransferase [Burkholderiales bacterium]
MAAGTVKKFLRPLVRSICHRIYRTGRAVEERELPAFATRPKNLSIDLPRRIRGAAYMHIGDDVHLGPGCLLIALDRYPLMPYADVDGRPRAVQQFRPRLVIGNRVTATAALTLAAHQEIVIEDDVLFASNINITDGLHGYANAEEPYKYQPIFRIGPIRIGRGAWIGQNVQVLPGVTIGELAIIGANSVVTRDVPPRSIAVGVPARVIKRWNEQRGRWEAPDAVTEERPVRFNR